jgi:hypothetical protein
MQAQQPDRSAPEISVSVGVDIYEFLKERSTFEDTFNSVLRRELGLPDPTLADGDDANAAVPHRGGHPVTDDKSAREPRQPARGRGRALHGKARSTTKAKRAAAGTLLPESEYHRPILEILAERGGSVPKQVVIEEVGRRLDGRLTVADRDELESGGIRWQSRAQFARLRLAERGLINKHAPRGIWAITPEGTMALEEGRIQ